MVEPIPIDREAFSSLFDDIVAAMAAVPVAAAKMNDSLTTEEADGLDLMAYRLAQRRSEVESLQRGQGADQETIRRRLKSIARELRSMLAGARLMLGRATPEQRAALAGDRPLTQWLA